MRSALCPFIELGLRGGHGKVEWKSAALPSTEESFADLPCPRRPGMRA